MKVIVINSSPNKEKGNTALIANPFVEELKTLGAEVDVFYAYDLKINPCLGCLNCLKNEKIKCVQSDDINKILPLFSKADIRVFVFPVYTSTVPGQLKNMIDRFLPLLSIFLDYKKERYRHRVKPGFNPGKFVLISSCNYWGKNIFDVSLQTFKELADDYSNQELSGSLLRPHSAIFRTKLTNKSKDTEEIIKASERAAQELFNDGKVSRESEEIISQELISEQDFAQVINNYYKNLDT